MEDANMLLEFFKYISRRFEAVVFVVEYTGYGPTRETHTPSMENTHADVDCCLDHVKAVEPGLPLLVWARSMGCAPALRSLASVPAGTCAGLVLESAFLTPLMTVVPFRLPLESDFENIDEIAHLPGVPILFIHGKKDTVVPSWHAETLFNAYENGPKTLVLVPTGSHNDLFGKMEHRSLVEVELEHFIQTYFLSKGDPPRV
jgi:fermentation-respiration switch protein FrsA (DUF1100 family)